MKGWWIFAIIALILWGLWGFFSKLATNYMRPKSVLVYEVLGTLIIGIISLSLLRFRPLVHPKGITFAILTGMSGGLGVLFFLSAVSRGKASVVVTTTALYPLITIILASFLLKEPITLKQGIGIILALIAMILLST